MRASREEINVSFRAFSLWKSFHFFLVICLILLFYKNESEEKVNLPPPG